MSQDNDDVPGVPTHWMSKNIRSILAFEHKITSLPDPSSEEPDEADHPSGEDLEEAREELRLRLLNELRASFRNELVADAELPSAVYEEVLFSYLSARVRRSFGYFHAIARAQKLVHDANNDVGDLAFRVDVNKTTTLLDHLDDIYFMRTLCTGLGVQPEDADRIVAHLIDRFFGPKDGSGKKDNST